jgi:hypothetical protein
VGIWRLCVGLVSLGSRKGFPSLPLHFGGFEGALMGVFGF